MSRGRGRPALVWPSCTIREELRGRIAAPRRHLTFALIKHCRGCPQCEGFHERGFRGPRWDAAWAGRKFFIGKVCAQCKTPYRRVHDAACYSCALEKSKRPEQRNWQDL